MWTAEELRALLPDPVQGTTEGTTLADVFMHHYGVEEAGNVDPMKVRESKDLHPWARRDGRAAPKHSGSNTSQAQWHSQDVSLSPFRTPIRS